MTSEVVWVDLPVTDLKRAMTFYSAITASKFHHFSEQVAALDHKSGHASICLFQSTDESPSKEGALIYINLSQSIENAIKQVEINGGKIIRPIHEIQPYGKRAIILDSEGNRIALHEPLDN
ncbi:VOC family protein [Marinicellulosiphila megalodicopiae]|uniref:VOC family protein n=1 Tax=Marinicellulosiphila megalodicopiae TaxID=2724896 RepID=UPI003BB0ACF0